MGMSYLPCEPRQQALLPQALQDWLPEGHLAAELTNSAGDAAQEWKLVCMALNLRRMATLSDS